MIVLDDVTAGYRLNPVFAHLSLRISGGSFTAIVGPTGAGKTTLLRVCLGLVPCSGGRVLVAGRPLAQARGRIGYVPQHGGAERFFPATVEQVILMGRAAHRHWPWPGRTEKRKAYDLAERLGVAECLGHHICDVSGGQRQRAFLARALICDPEILILDEPTAGVDLKTQKTCMEVLGSLHRAGMTVVITTHDLNGIAVHLPEVVCFNKGLVAQGPPARVFNDSVLAETFGEELTAIDHDGRLVVAARAPLDLAGEQG